jgi:hypothetical protein
VAGDIAIYIYGTTPSSPSSIPTAGNDFTQLLPFSDSPDGNSSWIQIIESVPGSSTLTAKVYDLTNQIMIGYLAPIWVVDVTTGTNLFQGFVQSYTVTPQATYRILDLSCVDTNWILDTHLVGVPNGGNWGSNDGGQTFQDGDPNAGLDGSDRVAVQRLFSDYWAYGVTVPETDTYVQEINSDITNGSGVPYVEDRKTLRQGLDDVCALSSPGTVCWMDQGVGHGYGSTSYVHLTTFSYNAGLPSGAGTVTLGPSGDVAGGPLVLLFPQSQSNVYTPGGSYASPWGISDEPDNVTTFAAENLKILWDFSGGAFSVYVRGATDYTANLAEIEPATVPPTYYVSTVNTGGTGWVGFTGDTGPGWLSRFVDNPNAIDHASRNSIGQAAVQRMIQPLIRGSGNVVGTMAPCHAGQTIPITSHATIEWASNPTPYVAWLYIQRMTLLLLSGAGYRRYGIEFGTAAAMNQGLRAQAQQRALTEALKLPNAANQQGLSATAYTTQPGGVVVCTTQLQNGAGQPWRIAGKKVNWVCQVIDVATQTDVTATTLGWSLNPTSTTTDVNGTASTTLTTDPTATGTAGLDYIVSSETPD